MRKIFNQKIINLLFFIAFALLFVFVFYQKKEIYSIKKEIAALSESVEKIDSFQQNGAKNEEKNEPKMTELFGFADIQRQLQTLKKQIESAKNANKNQSADTQKEEENRMVALAKDVNSNVYKMASQFFENQLKAANFEEDEIKKIMKTYTNAFNDIQEVQIKWLNGEILWEDMPSHIKPVYSSFYENLRRDVGEKAGKEAFNIFVPDKNFQKIILEQ